MASPAIVAASDRASRNQSPLPRGISNPSSRRERRFCNGNGHPDFTRMSPAERLAYHRERLGLGR